MADESITVTQLLKAWSGGDAAALNQLTPRVYAELRRMVGMYLNREPRGNTLQATALVHEVFLRMVEVDSVDWQDRAHFFAVAATMMRRLLVDQARGRAKRGEAAPHVNLEEALEIRADSDDRGIAAIDEALKALAEVDPRKEKVVELRFFGGLSVEETASVLGISPQSVMRDWKLARAWLMAEMGR